MSTERAALLCVKRGARGHIVERLQRGERLAPRVLGASRTHVEACVVPTQAGPLAGDLDLLRIVVGADASLIMRPIAATLALPGFARTRLDLDVELRPRARLVLDEPPLIVAADANVERSTTVSMAAGAVAALRETVVLGRSGEAGGRFAGTLRVTDDRGVVLHDALRLDPPTGDDAHVALPPHDRVAGTMLLLGLDTQYEQPAYALARGGALRRATARGLADLEGELGRPWARWAHAAVPSLAPTATAGPSSRPATDPAASCSADGFHH